MLREFDCHADVQELAADRLENAGHALQIKRDENVKLVHSVLAFAELHKAAEHDLGQYMEINKELLNDMPCYRQWFWADDDDATCAHDDIDTENYCPACKLNELLSKQEPGQ